MGHEYRGATCLQSNAANTESNAPPGISIHAPGLYFRVPRVHHHLSWTGFNGRPFKAPPSSEENTFFMSTHKLCLVPFSRPQSLSHLAAWPVSHRFPRLRSDFCLNRIYFPTCEPTTVAPLTMGRPCFYEINKIKRNFLEPAIVIPSRPESKDPRGLFIRSFFRRLPYI